MRKVYLRMNEDVKYQTIKTLVETNGNKKRAALKLSITIRSINRLIVKYKREGKSAFIHGNRCKEPKNKMDIDFSNKIITLAKGKYKGSKENYLLCNYSHFKYLLARDEGILITYTSLYLLLMNNNIRSPKMQRKTRKRLKKEEILKSKSKLVLEEKEIEQIVSHEIALEDAHPRRERSKYFGELIQMDASSKHWTPTLFAHLHLAIDDATGMVVGGFFDSQETLDGYYQVFKQILESFGAPGKFLTDKRTVFIYNKKGNKKDEKDTLTQFAFSCKNIGVDIETTSIPQNKAKIERCNGTFEDRLATELTLKGINTIEEANRYLIEYFIGESNRLFADDYTKFTSVFENVDKTMIPCYLSKVARRVFDKGCCISFKNEYYVPFNGNGKRAFFSYRTKCLVVETLNKDLFVNIDDQTYELRKIEKNAETSKNYDEEKPREPIKKYIPPMNHPWRYKNYDEFQEAFRNYKYSIG